MTSAFKITNNKSTLAGMFLNFNEAVRILVKSVRKLPKPFIEPIKCTGSGCNKLIQQKIANNTVKLCTRCQNRVYRRAFKK